MNQTMEKRIPFPLSSYSFEYRFTHSLQILIVHHWSSRACCSTLILVSRVTTFKVKTYHNLNWSMGKRVPFYLLSDFFDCEFTYSLQILVLDYSDDIAFTKYSLTISDKQSDASKIFRKKRFHRPLKESPQNESFKVYGYKQLVFK